MSFVESSFKWLDRTLRGWEDFLAMDTDSFCRLETVDIAGDEETPHRLVSTDGSIGSVIRINGLLSHNDQPQFDRLISHMHETMNTAFARTGHIMQFVYEYDPERTLGSIQKAMGPARRAVDAMGLDMDDVITDWQKALATYSAHEAAHVVLWTRPSVLQDAEAKQARSTRNKEQKAHPSGGEAQRTGWGIPTLRDIHDKTIDQIQKTFRANGIVSQTLTAPEALRLIRRNINPAATDDDWEPHIPPHNVAPRMEDFPSGDSDLSDVWYPMLSKQVFPWDAHTVDTKTVKVGDRYYAPSVLDLPPQFRRAFNGLFGKFREDDVPFRASFRITGDGMRSQYFNSTLAKMFSVFSPFSGNNQKIADAVDRLSELKTTHGETIVGFQACFTTWAKDKQTLSSRRNALKKNVEAWGSPLVSDVSGDPLIGLSATLPAYHPSGIASMAAAPLSEVFKMMPIERPVALWDEGTVPLRSEDGKVMPFQQNSSQQEYAVDVGVAPMGSGKSVLLNTLNLGFCLQASGSNLPRLCILDVGPSSKGLIELLKGGLPENKQWMAEYKRLSMDKSDAINPLDTPPGSRVPFSYKMDFLNNFVSLLITETSDQGPPPSGMELANACIKAAYERRMDVEGFETSEPYTYNPDVDPMVHEALEATGMEVKPHETLWWDVVDHLFEQYERFGDSRYMELLNRAQRQAVPTLNDVANATYKDSIKDMFGNKQSGHGDDLLSYFRTKIMTMRDRYEVLQGRTQFDIGDARVVSLDLGEVAKGTGPENEKRAAMMYMLGRQVGAGEFFHKKGDVERVPELYEEYHKNRVRRIREEEKRICADETHRFKDIERVMAQFQKDIREGRKHNIHVGLYSQSMKDFTHRINEDSMIDLANWASSVFVLGVGKGEELDYIQNKLDLNDEIRKKLNRQTGHPDQSGATMLGYFETNVDEGDGTVAQMMSNTLGPRALWALDSTPESAAVRDRMYDLEGLTPSEVRDILVEQYPNPARVEDIVKQRKEEFSGNPDKNAVESVVQDILDDVGYTSAA